MASKAVSPTVEEIISRLFRLQMIFLSFVRWIDKSNQVQKFDGQKQSPTTVTGCAKNLAKFY